MKVKVFQSNHNGKIEFTRTELEKLLNEVYTDGYNEGKSSNWTWTSPSINTTPYYSSTGTSIVNGEGTIKPTNYAADKIEAVLDNCIATANDSTATNKAAGSNPFYTVKVNGADISKLVNDIFGAGATRPKSAEDAFDKLAKELSF